MLCPHKLSTRGGNFVIFKVKYELIIAISDGEIRSSFKSIQNVVKLANSFRHS